MYAGDFGTRHPISGETPPEQGYTGLYHGPLPPETPLDPR